MSGASRIAKWPCVRCTRFISGLTGGLPSFVVNRKRAFITPFIGLGLVLKAFWGKPQVDTLKAALFGKRHPRIK